MEAQEYGKLARVEREHWFYRGKREIVRYWIKQTLALRSDSLLVDCGAGTGLFASEMTQQCRVLATDDHEDSLRLLREKLGADRVRNASCDRLPLETGSVDCLTALDVLEHVAQDREAVAEFCRVLKAGGVAVVTVPAMQKLWSDWDEVLHHFRRYDRAELENLFDPTAFEVVHLNYINILALPAIFLIRKVRLLLGSRGAGNRMEEFIPPLPLNELLRLSFVGPACQRAIQFPAGVGLLAVVRKR